MKFHFLSLIMPFFQCSTAFNPSISTVNWILGTNIGSFSAVFLCVVSAALFVFLVFGGFNLMIKLWTSKRYNTGDLAEIMLEMATAIQNSQHRQRAFEKKIDQKLELLGTAQVKTYKETGNALEIVAKRLEAVKSTEDISKIKAAINADFISLNRKLDTFLAKRKLDEEATIFILKKLQRVIGETTLEDIDKMHRTAAKHEFNRIIGAIEEYISGPYPGLKD